MKKMKPNSLASPGMQEIGKRNNIQYLDKWEIFFNSAYLSAVWLQFWKNHVQKSLSTMISMGFCPNSYQTADR